MRCQTRMMWMLPRMMACAGQMMMSSAGCSQKSACEKPAKHKKFKAKKKKKRTIVETAAKAGSFETLLSLARAVGLVDVLSNVAPLTLFAPTDEAFDRLPEGTLAALLKDPEKLSTVLRYHVVPGNLSEADLRSVGSVESLAGGMLRIDSGENLKVNESQVISADLRCQNGRIHVIDQVLIPA